MGIQILVTDAFRANMEDLDRLRGLGFDITFHTGEQTPVQDPERYEAIICNALFLYSDIRIFKNLKCIHLISAGLDRVPLDDIRERGIRLYNAAGVYSVPMAEWTVMRILELYKKAGNTYRDFRNRHWEKDRGWLELAGKRACIIGFGEYGKETAKRLKAFDVHVTVVNRTRKESPFVDAFYPLGAMMEQIAAADIVILAIGLAPETKGMFGRAQFAAMKPGAVFVNAARGGLVQEEALAGALTSGRLYGAAIDAFDPEPLPADSPLWDCEQMLFSPHNSFVGDGNRERLVGLICNNLSGFFGKTNE